MLSIQDYYDGQLVVVQKELKQMQEDEREEYLARDAMRSIDIYHQAIADSLMRRYDLSAEEEKTLMAEEDILAAQARIVERAFESMRRLSKLETTMYDRDYEEVNDEENSLVYSKLTLTLIVTHRRRMMKKTVHSSMNSS